MFKKFLLTVSMIFLLTITVLSCSDDSNSPDPEALFLTLTSPVGGEIWNVGGQRSIKWNFNSKGLVNIELYKNGSFYQSINNSADNSGTYNWIIPTDLPQENDYQIKITNVTDASITDMSNDFFGTSVPLVYLYDTSDIISNAEYKVQWYGNSNDSTNLNYFYCITTDTTMTNTQAETALAGLWDETVNNYADVSFPMVQLNSSELFIDSTTYIDTVEAIEVTRKVVFSKFFIYGVDEFGAVSEVNSKIFGRTNQRPKYPMVTSSEFDINGYDEYWFTIGPDSAALVLPDATDFWDPIGFRWMSEDPDGYDVKLEFKWELWALDGIGTDIEIISQSSGWADTYRSKSFSDVIYNYSAEGKFSFRVWVRDDALEEAENHATVNFETFAPTFEKGILLVDDTNTRVMGSYLVYEGNPDKDLVNTLYDELLQNSGYSIDSANPLTDYDYWNVESQGSPSLRTLGEYRLVIIQSEDRQKSISYLDPWGTLEDYLNVGGKVFLVGSSNLLIEDLKIDRYKEPIRVVFEDFNDSSQPFNEGIMEFFYTYFGIYSYTHPESKTFWSQSMYESGNPVLLGVIPEDYCYTDNYGFVGVIPYGHITDPNFADLNIDSIVVNTYWVDADAPLSTTVDLALKNNGSVFTGIPSFEAFKGEVVYQYKSVYDDDTYTDFREWTNPNLADSLNLSGPVTTRDGAVLTRCIADNDQYRTAMCTLPLIFMDNSDESVSNMFKAMIDWFDLELDPSDNWKKK
ncbi:MAG: GPI anchored serine-threonine rich family protein [Candidatus Delongbacteria bacterium]|jgi:hypothetical protein|nr:GPI anchored serine-threonine rich family protein [Candidatus Delongbacteria bacterium]